MLFRIINKKEDPQTKKTTTNTTNHNAKGSAIGKCSSVVGYGLFSLDGCLLPSLENIDVQGGVYALGCTEPAYHDRRRSEDNRGI